MEEYREVQNKFYKAIGRIPIEFNDLEGKISQLISEIIFKEEFSRGPIADCILIKMQFKSKIDLLRAVIIQTFGEEEDERFSLFYNRLNGIANLRNDFLHSEWFISINQETNKVETMKYNPRHALKDGKKVDHSKSWKEIEVKEIQDLLRELITLQNELFHYVRFTLNIAPTYRFEIVTSNKEQLT